MSLGRINLLLTSTLKTSVGKIFDFLPIRKYFCCSVQFFEKDFIRKGGETGSVKPWQPGKQHDRYAKGAKSRHFLEI